ncbi:MAG: M13 family metallopeptidase, partial [Pyrinomonadaceae bacterium]
MRFLNLRFISSLLLAASLGFVATVPGGDTRRGVDLSKMDTTCKPCEDFYKYANGGWLKSTTIPAAYPSWGVGHTVNERTRDTLREILEESARNKDARKGSNEQLVGDYFAACMDEAKIETEGAKPLAPAFARIEKIKSLSDVQAEVANLHRQGIGTLFGFGPSPDLKNSAMVIGSVGQGGLSLPNPEYYTKTDEKSKQIREDFLKHVARMFELHGAAPERASASARTVLAIQTRLAESSRTPVQLRDINSQYNKMTVAQLKELAPNFGWEAYFADRGAPRMSDLNVAHPEFFKNLSVMLADVALDDWKTYLRWHLINGTASRLSTPFVNENFNFYSRKLTGQQELLPRWKRCVTGTDGALGDAVGQVYVRKAFPPEAKARMQELISNLVAAYRERLMSIEWMGEATRRESLAKLEAFTQKIGYPDKWKTYAGLDIAPGTYLDNTFRVASYEIKRNLGKIGRPVDRGEWILTAPTLNAYYYGPNNEIVFPAGILQPPFFDPKADDALNYGAIGAVIGHEITHGFDDKGSTFDAKGNLRNWWTDEDRKNFMDRAGCIERQFNAYKVEENLTINGKLTLGENIGDLGGLSMAYAAYKKSLEGKEPAVIDGFTADQRFFIGYAQIWASLARPEYERLIVNSDPHSLPRFRVNGPLSNMPQFAAAFGCKEGDPMVRAEADRCRVW